MMCRFPSTNWPLVAATRSASPSRAPEPLAELCDRYWHPVFAYLRQCGHRRDDAEDLTQGFFMHLLSKRILERAEPERGRLRTLLLTCLTNFVANEQNLQRAKKRGGPAPAAVQSVDARDVEPRADLTPEIVYERQWAVMLLRRALEQLRAELARTGRQHVFDALKDALVGEPPSYRTAAERLRTTEGNARVTAHRLRRRYRELLSHQIAGTLNGPSVDVDDEIRYLLRVVQRPPRASVS
jgi:RNA polymerase sigma factor (sigma-70 family)